MADKTYTVHKSMHGDGRDYAPGDTRTMSEADAKELVEVGALSAKGEDPKVREPAVVHTFGTAAPTGHLSTTSATGEPFVAAAIVQPARVEAPAAAKAIKAPHKA